LTQLTKIGIGGVTEAIIQWAFFLLALLGLVFAWRDRRFAGALMCASFVIVPSILLAFFRTGNTVFQRYGLFTLPFYLLLAANGLVGLRMLFPNGKRAGTETRPYSLLLTRYPLAVLFVLPFAYSAFVYYDPAQYR